MKQDQDSPAMLFHCVMIHVIINYGIFVNTKWYYGFLYYIGGLHGYFVSHVINVRYNVECCHFFL